MNLETLKSRIRSLVDDDAGTYTTDQFLLPKINQKYEEMYQQIKLAGGEFDEQVVELSSVPAGTMNLNAYQDSGQPLELLLDPTMLEWRLPGMDPINYTRSEGPLDKVRDIIPGPFIDSWEFRGQNIYLTPANIPLDIRITGGFAFTPLTDNADRVMAGVQIGHAIVYGVASLIGTVRGNPGWEKTYGQNASDAIDTLAQLLTRAQQSKIRRVARMSRNWRTRHFRGPQNVTQSSSGSQASTPVQVNQYNVNTTLTASFLDLFAECTGGVSGITMGLFPTTQGKGYRVTLKKMDATSAGPVIVTAQTGQGDSIDGNATYTLTNQNQFVSLVSDGAGNWNVAANN